MVRKQLAMCTQFGMPLSLPFQPGTRIMPAIQLDYVCHLFDYKCNNSFEYMRSLMTNEQFITLFCIVCLNNYLTFNGTAEDWVHVSWRGACCR